MAFGTSLLSELIIFGAILAIFAVGTLISFKLIGSIEGEADLRESGYSPPERSEDSV
ncbi:MAG: hypothetical protein ACYC7D_15595 [Nitrososphaerales archaeon]